MRLLNQNNGLLRLDSISMPPAVLEVLRRSIHKPSANSKPSWTAIPRQAGQLEAVA